MARVLLLALALFLGDVHAAPRPRDEGTFVSDISQCPTLVPRSPKSTSIQNVRPDEFNVVMAIGDSITAGAFAQGLQSDPLLDIVEWRGLSFAAGGDPGALTLPNLIKHYNPNLTGFSLGEHVVEVCFGALCPVGPVGWTPSQDQFNAALSGAMASNLLHEVRDYLVPFVELRGISASAFKYMNLMIGPNDVCQMCLEAGTPTSADDFEASVREAMEYVRENIPNTLVNVVGVLPVTQVYELTLNSNGYCPEVLGIIPNAVECTCLSAPGAIGNATRSLMDDLIQQYNERLLQIVQDYQAAASPTFAAIWQPPNVPLATFPVQALSNVDCFHPSTASHQRIAAAFWNRLPADAATRAEPLVWADPVMRCLEPGDLIQTQGALGLTSP